MADAVVLGVVRCVAGGGCVTVVGGEVVSVDASVECAGCCSVDSDVCVAEEGYGYAWDWPVGGGTVYGV